MWIYNKNNMYKHLATFIIYLAQIYIEEKTRKKDWRRKYRKSCLKRLLKNRQNKGTKEKW